MCVNLEETNTRIVQFDPLKQISVNETRKVQKSQKYGDNTEILVCQSAT